MGPHDRARDDLGEPPRVGVRRAPVERHEHVEALAARRLRERHELERVEQLLRIERHLDRLRPGHLGRRVEIEEDEVGTVGPIDARIPRVHVDAAHVHHPEQRQLVVDDREVDHFFVRACRVETCARKVWIHSGMCVGRVLLEERLAVGAVGVAAHRERPVRAGAGRSTGATAR